MNFYLSLDLKKSIPDLDILELCLITYLEKLQIPFYSMHLIIFIEWYIEQCKIKLEWLDLHFWELHHNFTLNPINLKTNMNLNSQILVLSEQKKKFSTSFSILQNKLLISPPPPSWNITGLIYSLRNTYRKYAELFFFGWICWWTLWFNILQYFFFLGW